MTDTPGFSRRIFFLVCVFSLPGRIRAQAPGKTRLPKTKRGAAANDRIQFFRILEEDHYRPPKD